MNDQPHEHEYDANGGCYRCISERLDKAEGEAARLKLLLWDVSDDLLRGDVRAALARLRPDVQGPRSTSDPPVKP